MKKILALCLAALAAVSALAQSVPVFNATLTMGKEHRFLLIGADGKSSSFLQVGDTFDGYTIKSYDAKASSLDLEKDGKVTTIRLASDAAVAAGTAAPLRATLDDAENVLKKMHVEELLTKAVERQTKMVTSSFDGQMKQMIAQGVSREDATEFRDKLVEELNSMLNPTELKNDMMKIYSEVFTKDELDNMAAYYSTPMGQTIANKQGDVQEKLGAIVQARMQQGLPRIQKIGRDFQMQQQAKKNAAQQAAPAPAPQTPAPTP